MALYIIIVLLLGFIVFLINEINSIKEQLKYINNEERTNNRIRVSIQAFKIDSLAEEINKLINKHTGKEKELEYEKNKIKTQITSISHDLRTPLTSIKGYLDLIEKTEDKEEFKSYLEILNKKTLRLEKLVKDFYEISLLDDTNYVLELEPTMAGTILEDVLMEYYKDIEDNGIKLEIDLEDDKEVLLNQNALSRVYSNLLSNIKKHGIDKAEIFHGIRNGVLVTSFKNKIKDSNLVDENKLFEKFYTGEKSRHEENSGIGMYSSKILAEKMGMKITGQIKDAYLIINIEY